MLNKERRCNCGEECYSSTYYCIDCYNVYRENQKLRKRCKENEPKFEKLSNYINQMELKGGFGLEDISEIIEMYDLFYGTQLSSQEISVGTMWKKLKKINGPV